jgi:hypothetical protein
MASLMEILMIKPRYLVALIEKHLAGPVLLGW